MTEKVMIYIDGSNVYHSLRALDRRTELDFQKFSNELAGDRQLVRTYYYNAMVDETKEPETYGKQQQFFAMLKGVPYFELRLAKVVYPSKWPTAPAYEKGVDVHLAIDMVTHAARDNYDVAVLVSADNDFAEAMHAVKDFGKNIEVALFGTNLETSQQLREAADKVTVIDPAFLRKVSTLRRRRQSRRGGSVKGQAGDDNGSEAAFSQSSRTG
jgi:uncharacterized LabA/DUF88 family protein